MTNQSNPTEVLDEVYQYAEELRISEQARADNLDANTATVPKVVAMGKVQGALDIQKKILDYKQLLLHLPGFVLPDYYKVKPQGETETAIKSLPSVTDLMMGLLIGIVLGVAGTVAVLYPW